MCGKGCGRLEKPEPNRRDEAGLSSENTSRKPYAYVIISAGLGENQKTDFIRMDSKAKGYTMGQPDLELKCKMGKATPTPLPSSSRTPTAQTR